jgi:hypothetical protein
VQIELVEGKAAHEEPVGAECFRAAKKPSHIVSPNYEFPVRIYTVVEQ